MIISDVTINGQPKASISVGIVSDNSYSDLNIGDEQGNVLVKFQDGHLMTQKFNSNFITNDNSAANLNISDEDGYVILQLKDGHIKTKNFDSRDSSSQEYQPWNGKIITCLGDSITAGVGATSPNNYYPARIAALTGATVINAGVSGTTISKVAAGSYVDRVKNINTSSDLIIINGATNDYWHKNTNIGEVNSNDETTLCGALHSIFSWIQDNVPYMKILFVFPMHQYFSGSSDSTDFGHGSFSQFRDAAKTVCDMRSVPFLDLMNTSGIDVRYSVAHRNLYSSDGVHLSDTGYDFMAKKIVRYINFTL